MGGALVTLLATVSLVGASSGASALSGKALPSSVNLNGWDTVSASWTPGNTVQYSEGQAIPFRLNLSGLATGTSYLVNICREFQNGTKYGFLYLEEYNATVPLTSAQAGGTVTDQLGPFAGINATVTAVQDFTSSGGICGPQERLVQATVKPTAATSYLLWGGHLASPNETVPASTSIVRFGNGAGSYPGSSLAMRLACPDKTVPVPVNKIVNLARLSVTKAVEPGGTAAPHDWSFTIEGPNLPPGYPTPTLRPTPGGTAVEFLSLPTGTYTIRESGPSGYRLKSVTGTNCVALDFAAGTGSASVTAAARAPVNASCAFTNTAKPTRLIVHKQVVNDHGGTKRAADFSFSLSGGPPVAFEADGENELSVSPGAYSVTEAAAVGYTTSYSAGCTGSIALGETKTCAITNDDIAPKLVVIKHVVNDDGGTKTASDFTMSVDDAGTDPASFPGAESPGTEVTVDPGAYSVGESGPSGYAAGYSADCSGTIGLGETKTCTVTNDDARATLIVKKVVVNDDGGTKVASNFSFKVNGGSAVAFEADGQNELAIGAGTYSVTEPAVAGYATSYDNCADLVIANGGTATCTITNDDEIATSVEVTKTVEPASRPEPGGLFTFTFAVRNLSAESVRLTALDDTIYGNLFLRGDCDALEGLELAAAGREGDSAACSFGVVLDEVDAGFTETNQVKATVVDDEGDEASDTDTATLVITDVPSSITVVKTASPTAVQDSGTVTFSVVVRNESSVDGVTITSLVDSIHGDLDGKGTCDVPQTLAPGASYTCSFQAVVSQTETDVVTASGRDDDEQAVTASDDATVTVTKTPPPPPQSAIDVAVTKAATPQVQLPQGGGSAALTYDLVVRNNGPDPAVNVQVADPAPTGVTLQSATTSKGTCSTSAALLQCTIASLAPGESAAITVQATVSVTGTVVNVVTATGQGGPDANPSNNTAEARTLVTAPLAPPKPKPAPKPAPRPKPKPVPDVCKTLVATPRMLKANGAAQTVTARVKQGAKPVRGARVLVVGPGIRKSVVTNAQGIARIALRPGKAGILRLQVVNKKTCNTQRVGVVGVFEPPVTG